MRPWMVRQAKKNPRVIHIPGKFRVHPEGSMTDEGGRQLRISYGFEELEKLREAVDLMGKAAEFARRGG
jgi:hypothetical protein